MQIKDWMDTDKLRLSSFCSNILILGYHIPILCSLGIPLRFSREESPPKICADPATAGG